MTSPVEGTRIWIIGPPAAGKSRLAQALAHALGYDLLALDTLYWEPGWRRASPETFHERVACGLEAESWVADGFYDEVAPALAQRATMLVHLDPSLRVAVLRLVQRTVRQIVKGEGPWPGQRESIRRLFSSQSIFVYQSRVFWRCRDLGHRLSSEFRSDGRWALRFGSADEGLPVVLQALARSERGIQSERDPNRLGTNIV